MKKILITSSLMSVLSLQAQLTPVVNVPSPEVSTLGLYGSIPVSHFTGIPDISVPLYEVKVGNYNPDGSWTVVSDQDIIVEFDAQGDGFIRGSTLSQRIDISHWANKGSNDRFFNKFTLITPDGCRYEFGGLYASDYSISYYKRYRLYKRVGLLLLNKEAILLQSAQTVKLIL